MTGSALSTRWSSVGLRCAHSWCAFADELCKVIAPSLGGIEPHYVVEKLPLVRRVLEFGEGSKAIFTAPDVGWAMGHSFIDYGPVLTGATTVIYEVRPVGVPDQKASGCVVDDTQATILYAALRAIRREDSGLTKLAAHDNSTLREPFVAGELAAAR